MSLPVSPTAAVEPRLASDWCEADTVWRRNTNRKAQVTMDPRGRLGALSDVCGASVVMRQEDGRGYCFEGVAGAAEAAVATVEQQGGGRVRPGRDEHGAGAGARVAFVASGVADELADGAQRRQVLAPALGPILLVLDGVPGEEDEDEADELEAGGQAEVDEAEGGDVVFPAGAVHAAVLLPQHAGGVDHSTKVDGRGDVGKSSEQDKLHPKSKRPLLFINRPECDDDGRGLGTGGDKSNDKEEDEERDESVAGAVALPRHSVAVLV